MGCLSIKYASGGQYSRDYAGSIPSLSDRDAVSVAEKLRNMQISTVLQQQTESLGGLR